MNLIRRNTNNLFPTIFDDFFGSDFFDAPVKHTVPAVNVKENEKEFQVEVAAPGMNKKDFNLELNKDLLTISYDKKVENKKEEEGYTRKEFSHSSFKRSFVMPENVDAENIQAAYKDGILTLSIPKVIEKAAEPKRIAIS